MFRVAGSRVRDHESEARQGQITEELLMLFLCDKKTLKLPCAILMLLWVSPRGLPRGVFRDVLGQRLSGSSDLLQLISPDLSTHPVSVSPGWTSFRGVRPWLRLVACWLKVTTFPWLTSGTEHISCKLAKEPTVQQRPPQIRRVVSLGVNPVPNWANICSRT